MASPQITDRAKRYRAQKNVTGPKKCAICGKGGKLDVMHLTGNESHGEKENLAYGCRSCNAALGAAFKKVGAGRPTNQYNPTKKGIPTFEQYMWAVSNHSRGAHDAGGAVIHATPKHKRVEYARRILGKARQTKRSKFDDRWNPAGESAEVFEDFHGFKPSEVVTVSKRVHHHEHLAALGTLTLLEVRGIDGEDHAVTGFKKALLCTNEDCNQLFIEGGDQQMKLSDFGIRQQHEIETLGRVTNIGYQTNKTHLGDEGGEAVYVHRFRATNKAGKHVIVKMTREPDLIYDVRNEQLLFSGGSYEILREGINK